jgi:hypothetical protein
MSGVFATRVRAALASCALLLMLVPEVASGQT